MEYCANGLDLVIFRAGGVARASDDNRSCDSSRAPRASGRARPPIDMWVSLASMGANPLDPSSDDTDAAAGNGASLGQPFNNDDASQHLASTQKLSESCSTCNDEDMAAAEEALKEIRQAETQVADDYDAAEEQAGVEFLEREVTAQERPNTGFMPPIEQAVASHVPPARQLLPHTKKDKRGQGPVERALLSDPATPSYPPVASPDNSPQASPEAEAEPPAPPSYSPWASPDCSPQASRPCRPSLLKCGFSG